MASSEARRRKQLEKKKKKRTEKQHQIKVRQNAGIGEKLIMRAKAPIYECLISSDIDHDGLVEVVISRCSASGEIAFSLFLIDRQCMGVKDCYSRIVTTVRYREFVDNMKDHGRALRSIDPPSARRLVEDAVAYADDLGLKPHRDYRASKMIFGDVDPDRAVRIFEMGKDGKPFFMSGPFQSQQECAGIIAKLTERCGAGGFHYMVAMRPNDQIWRLDQDPESGFDDDDDDNGLEWSDDTVAEAPRVRIIDPAA